MLLNTPQADKEKVEQKWLHSYTLCGIPVEITAEVLYRFYHFLS